MAITRHLRAAWLRPAFLVLVFSSNANAQSILTPPEAPTFTEAPDFAIDWHDRVRTDIDLTLEDYGHFWSPLGSAEFAVGVGVAAALANTDADRSIRRWYRDRVRDRGADDSATVASWVGQLWIVVPVGLETAALCGKAEEGYQFDGGWFEWGNRSLRALAVGYPPLLATAVIAGASRPDEHGSGWHPFNDVHGVSGHTFAGAVPFLTAAEMTDSYWLKVPLVAGSFLSGWARLHDDRHYASQIALGWWMAFLSVQAVGETQAAHRTVNIGPAITPEGAGVLLEVKY
jgi:hypothetical protein